MMADEPVLPRWARDLKDRIDARMAAVFVLHFNVADEVRFGDQFLPLPTFLGRWLTGDERRRGTLLPGYFADLVVLDRDPLECPPEELGEIEVVATMLGGRWVHNPPPW